MATVHLPPPPTREPSIPQVPVERDPVIEFPPAGPGPTDPEVLVLRRDLVALCFLLLCFVAFGLVNLAGLLTGLLR
jgi:hypothetical protein